VTATAIETSTTREEILSVARNLIQTRSYLGFSFQDVADQVGIRKPSLYHHFPTKEALGIEVLHAATDAFRKWAAATSPTAARKLSAYFELYRWGLRAGLAMCPAGALAPGWDCIEPKLRSAVRSLRDEQVQWLSGVFSADPRNHRRAGELAAFVFAACQGALLSARMTGSVEDFDTVIAQVRAAIRAKKFNLVPRSSS
jgi:TetR/AcrR family transcriptional regulator, transcriptional repressor for nem operon